MGARDRYLFISDLQIPFEAPGALRFVLAVARDFGIQVKPDNKRASNVYCVGDEIDEYFGSQYKKDPDGWYTANSELAATRDKLRQWYQAFPQMKLAVSNHGLRWAKKAWEAEIPSQMLRPYQELIEAPKGWVWKERWDVPSKVPVTMIHGLGFGGTHAHRQAAIDLGTNVVMGHLHTNAGTSWVKTEGKACWGLATGCLIDADAYAFSYGKYNRNKPVLGVGVVLDGGLTPIFVPYEAHL